jgi:hypothetical protein
VKTSNLTGKINVLQFKGKYRMRRTIIIEEERFVSGLLLHVDA